MSPAPPTPPSHFLPPLGRNLSKYPSDTLLSHLLTLGKIFLPRERPLPAQPVRAPSTRLPSVQSTYIIATSLLCLVSKPSLARVKRVVLPPLLPIRPTFGPRPKRLSPPPNQPSRPQTKTSTRSSATMTTNKQPPRRGLSRLSSVERNGSRKSRTRRVKNV